MAFTPTGCDNLAQGKTAKLSPPWVAGPIPNCTLKGCIPVLFVGTQGAPQSRRPWARLSHPFGVKNKIPHNTAAGFLLHAGIGLSPRTRTGSGSVGSALAGAGSITNRVRTHSSSASRASPIGIIR